MSEAKRLIKLWDRSNTFKILTMREFRYASKDCFEPIWIFLHPAEKSLHSSSDSVSAVLCTAAGSLPAKKSIPCLCLDSAPAIDSPPSLSCNQSFDRSPTSTNK
jgi:hypothetical protein